MIGTNTALQDDPALNTRHWTGPNPVRLVVDMNMRLPATLQVFDKKQKTIVFNAVKNEEHENLIFYKIDKEPSMVKGILKACYELGAAKHYHRRGQQAGRIVYKRTRMGRGKGDRKQPFDN